MLTTSPASIAAIIDHTLLRADAEPFDIDRLCAEAIEYGFASVCVNPCWVARAAQALDGRLVAVCTVVGFPLGATTTDVKVFEAARVLADGAHEIDMVANIGLIRSGLVEAVRDDVAAVASQCRAAGATTKVILETSLLTDDQKTAGARAALDAGADYVKTSTGFGPGGATPADVAILREAVGGRLGIKASGGIRDLAAVQALVAAGATRIGTRAGLRIVEEARRALKSRGNSL